MVPSIIDVCSLGTQTPHKNVFTWGLGTETKMYGAMIESFPFSSSSSS